jgi:hypothetical protein
MTGAIEFLRKAKAICDSESARREIMYDTIDCIGGTIGALPPADLVRKVMAYQIKEDTDARDITIEK